MVRQDEIRLFSRRECRESFRNAKWFGILKMWGPETARRREQDPFRHVRRCYDNPPMDSTRKEPNLLRS